MSVMCSSMTLSVSCMTGLPMVGSSGGSSPLSVMLMLRGAVLSDVLRAISALVVEFATFRGSVGPWPTGVLGGPNGWAGGGCDRAVPGATGWVGVCWETVEGLREWMGTFVVAVVGAGAGAGAGRV